MPANLTPQYHKAEQVYKEATTVEEKIAALEEMLAVIPKHKGTDHLQADLKTEAREAQGGGEPAEVEEGGLRPLPRGARRRRDGHPPRRPQRREVGDRGEVHEGSARSRRRFPSPRRAPFRG